MVVVLEVILELMFAVVRQLHDHAEEEGGDDDVKHSFR
jgi:hypothetical protein